MAQRFPPGDTQRHPTTLQRPNLGLLGARAHIDAGKARRAGLVATNSIRGGANRQTRLTLAEGCLSRLISRRLRELEHVGLGQAEQSVTV